MKRTPSESAIIVTGLTAISLTALFAVASVIIPIVNRRLTKPIDIGNDLSLPFLLTVLALAMTYVYGRLEQVAEKQDTMSRRPFNGVEEYNSSAALLDRLSEVSVGASKISTLNLSSPMGTHKRLDAYFRKLHKYICEGNTDLSQFQSIASIDSQEKLAWIMKRAVMLNSSGRASLAVIKQTSVSAIPLGFHIAYRGDEGYVFFYPPVDLTGQMRCFLIKNTQIADIMQFYFDMLWLNSPQICAAGRVYSSGLAFAESVYPDITNDPDFQTLKKKAI